MRVVLSFVFSLAAVTAAHAQDRNAIVVDTTLDAIRTDPEAYKRVWVRFPVQFCSLGRVSNPFFTRFVPSDFANFFAWSIAQPIWREKEYEDVFGMLFLSKSSDQIEELYHLELYDRLEITGVVRNTFQSAPWIEVTSFRHLGSKANTAALAHLYRGEKLMSERRWQHAASELSQAPTGDVPDELRAAAYHNLGVCYLRLGEVDKARSHLATASSLQGRPDRETTRLVAAADDAPESELDRAVDRSAVRDHERPMWEAFESLESSPIR